MSGACFEEILVFCYKICICFILYSGLRKIKSVILIFLCDFLLRMHRWLQSVTLKKKDVTFEKAKPAAHSITSTDEPTIKKDDNQAMHSSVCLSEELPAKETICESAAPHCFQPWSHVSRAARHIR